MKNSLYDSTIPVFVKFLGILLKLTGKGESFAKRKKRTEKFLLEARLAPDMFTYTQQVQYAYFMALETATVLSGRPMPEFAYDEKTVKELKKSLARAIAFLKTVRPKELATAHKKKIKTFIDPKKRFAAVHYVHMLAIPNFFFHVTTAYDILRHLGVSIGKDDYLG